MELEGQVAAITGAASGIGAATAPPALRSKARRSAPFSSRVIPGWALKRRCVGVPLRLMLGSPTDHMEGRHLNSSHTPPAYAFHYGQGFNRGQPAEPKAEAI